jgi:predicted O-methyltransferase YrrM
MRLGGLFRERNFYQSRAAVSAYRGIRRVLSKAGVQVVAKTFYSPIPDLDALPAGTFERVSELPGIEWDLDAQLRFVHEQLGPAMREFHPPASSNGDRWQYATNESYTLADATLLYGMLRSLRPRRVLELGSGHSTLVTAQAARANAADGHPLELEVYDPFPSVVGEELPGLGRLERTLAQDVPLEAFERLQAGDVLFVDTTHTVKVGGDVNFIVLEVLPRLAEGVIVHVHDIFLPYEYPKKWLEDFGLYWTEQYLLQAFLACSSGYEVLVALHALQRDRRDQMVDVLAPAAVDWPGGAFWMRRRAASA